MTTVVYVPTDREFHLKSMSERINLGGIGEHESIFKYISLDGKMSWNYLERTLRENVLIGATLNSLNDPLEGKPRIFNDLTRDKYEDCCLYFDRSGKQRNEQRLEDSIPFEQLEAHVLERLKNTKEMARILSFARRSDSHLLWSHYANSHRGACLHFSLGAFDHPALTAGLVGYTQNRPVLPMSLMARIALPPETEHHPDDRKALRSELYRGLFFTKPLDWSYEEEARVIYSTADMTNVPFQKGGLYEIILGAKCNAEDQKKIRSLVKRYSNKVVVRSAKITDDTFSVEIS